ncbi:hypothetical protein NL676_028548 [Syzygium grande]|nr:hypothetical protein NL676_028548 [Syzygium grande]
MNGDLPIHIMSKMGHVELIEKLHQDERIQLILLNHQCMTAHDIALDRMRREYKFRKLLAVMMLGTTSIVNPDSLVLRPETRDEALSTCRTNEKKRNMDRVYDVINTRLLVATIVATVTFAAGFAVPGGFNSSDMASKDDQGAMFKFPPFFQSQRRPIRLLMFWIVLARVHLWGTKAYPLDDLEEDGTVDGTSASQPPDRDSESND